MDILKRITDRYRELGLLLERDDHSVLVQPMTETEVLAGAEGLELEAPRVLESGATAVPNRLFELRQMARALEVPDDSIDTPDFEERLLTFTASDDTCDRYGCRILVDGTFEGKKYGKGWQLKNYQRNPVFMPFHSYSTIPLGIALDTWRDEAKGGRKRLRQTVMMDDGTANPAAPFILAAFKSRLMRAVSVGFWPLKIHEPADDEERAKLGLGRYGVLFCEQELWENSAVSIPANPNALLEGLDLKRAADVKALADRVSDVYPELAYQIRSAAEAPRSTVAVRITPPMVPAELPELEAPADPASGTTTNAIPPVDNGPGAATISAISKTLAPALDRFSGLCDRLENLIAEAEGTAIGMRAAPAAEAPTVPPAASPARARYEELLDILGETRAAIAPRSDNAPQ